MRYSKIYKIILVIVSITVILACDVLVTDIRARTNPNDQNTTIQPAYNVAASVTVESNDRTRVDITWDWSNNEGESTVVGFIVMRKAGSVPTSVYDGTCIYLNRSTEEMECAEYIDEDPDFPELGQSFYYAVFTFAAKSGDENELEEGEKISATTIDNGFIDEVYNRQYYDFNGPVYDVVDIYAYYDLEILYDSYTATIVDWAAAESDNNFELRTGAASEATGIAYIVFGLLPADLEDVDVKEASFRLCTYTNGSSGAIEAAPFANDYQSYNSTDLFDSTACIDSNYTVYLDVSGFESDYSSADVTSIYNAWDSGTLDNFGLRLFYEGTLSEHFQFWSSEGANYEQWPRLRVYYMNE